MPNLATWIRQKDAKSFAQFLRTPRDQSLERGTRNVPLDEMDGLLLSGGSDIFPEFLRQDVPDPSVLDNRSTRSANRWSFRLSRTRSRAVCRFWHLQRSSGLQRSHSAARQARHSRHNLPWQSIVMFSRCEARRGHRIVFPK